MTGAARETTVDVIDRWIAQADRIAARRQAREQWCEHARWRFLAEQLRQIRAEVERVEKCS